METASPAGELGQRQQVEQLAPFQAWQMTTRIRFLPKANHRPHRFESSMWRMLWYKCVERHRAVSDVTGAML